MSLCLDTSTLDHACLFWLPHSKTITQWCSTCVASRRFGFNPQQLQLKLLRWQGMKATHLRELLPVKHTILGMTGKKSDSVKGNFICFKYKHNQIFKENLVNCTDITLPQQFSLIQENVVQNSTKEGGKKLAHTLDQRQIQILHQGNYSFTLKMQANIFERTFQKATYLNALQKSWFL